MKCHEMPFRTFRPGCLSSARRRKQWRYHHAEGCNSGALQCISPGYEHCFCSRQGGRRQREVRTRDRWFWERKRERETEGVLYQAATSTGFSAPKELEFPSFVTCARLTPHSIVIAVGDLSWVNRSGCRKTVKCWWCYTEAHGGLLIILSPSSC